MAHEPSDVSTFDTTNPRRNINLYRVHISPGDDALLSESTAQPFNRQLDTGRRIREAYEAAVVRACLLAGRDNPQRTVSVGVIGAAHLYSVWKWIAHLRHSGLFGLRVVLVDADPLAPGEHGVRAVQRWVDGSAGGRYATLETATSWADVAAPLDVVVGIDTDHSSATPASDEKAMQERMRAGEVGRSVIVRLEQGRFRLQAARAGVGRAGEVIPADELCGRLAAAYPLTK